MGNDKNGLMIDSLHVLYQETTAHLMRSRQSMKTDIPTLRGEMFSVGDMVLLKDHQKGKLLPQFSQTYRVLQKIADKTVDLIDLQGVVRRATFAQLKKVTPTEALLMTIPTNLQFSRQAKYLKSALPEVLQAIAKDSMKQQGSDDMCPSPSTQKLTNASRWATHQK